MTVKYIVFPSSEYFEVFQKENKINLMQITPLVSGFNFQTTEESMKGETNISVFVVYSDKEEKYGSTI